MYQMPSSLCSCDRWWWSKNKKTLWHNRTQVTQLDTVLVSHWLERSLIKLISVLLKCFLSTDTDMTFPRYFKIKEFAVIDRASWANFLILFAKFGSVNFVKSNPWWGNLWSQESAHSLRNTSKDSTGMQNRQSSQMQSTKFKTFCVLGLQTQFPWTITEFKNTVSQCVSAALAYEQTLNSDHAIPPNRRPYAL